MGELYFSPTGRIGPQAYLMGVIILAVISGFFGISVLIDFQKGSMLWLANFLLLYPLFCLTIKRVHDAGNSGWMSLIWVFIVVLIVIILESMAKNLTGGEPLAQQKQAMQDLAASAPSFQEIMAQSQVLALEYGEKIAKNTALAKALAGIVGAALGAYLVNLANKHEPNENQYGPA